MRLLAWVRRYTPLGKKPQLRAKSWNPEHEGWTMEVVVDDEIVGRGANARRGAAGEAALDSALKRFPKHQVKGKAASSGLSASCGLAAGGTVIGTVNMSSAEKDLTSRLKHLLIQTTKEARSGAPWLRAKKTYAGRESVWNVDVLCGEHVLGTGTSGRRSTAGESALEFAVRSLVEFSHSHSSSGNIAETYQLPFASTTPMLPAGVTAGVPETDSNGAPTACCNEGCGETTGLERDEDSPDQFYCQRCWTDYSTQGAEGRASQRNSSGSPAADAEANTTATTPTSSPSPTPSAGASEELADKLRATTAAAASRLAAAETRALPPQGLNGLGGISGLNGLDGLGGLDTGPNGLMSPSSIDWLDETPPMASTWAADGSVLGNDGRSALPTASLPTLPHHHAHSDGSSALAHFHGTGPGDSVGVHGLGDMSIGGMGLHDQLPMGALSVTAPAFAPSITSWSQADQSDFAPTVLDAVGQPVRRSNPAQLLKAAAKQAYQQRPADFNPHATFLPSMTHDMGIDSAHDLQDTVTQPDYHSQLHHEGSGSSVGSGGGGSPFLHSGPPHAQHSPHAQQHGGSPHFPPNASAAEQQQQLSFQQQQQQQQQQQRRRQSSVGSSGFDNAGGHSQWSTQADVAWNPHDDTVQIVQSTKPNWSSEPEGYAGWANAGLFKGGEGSAVPDSSATAAGQVAQQKRHSGQNVGDWRAPNMGSRARASSTDASTAASVNKWHAPNTGSKPQQALAQTSGRAAHTEQAEDWMRSPEPAATDNGAGLPPAWAAAQRNTSHVAGSGQQQQHTSSHAPPSSHSMAQRGGMSDGGTQHPGQFEDTPRWQKDQQQQQQQQQQQRQRQQQQQQGSVEHGGQQNTDAWSDMPQGFANFQYDTNIW